MEGLIASYLRQERSERRRLFETTREAVKRGFGGDDAPFDQVFPEPQPKPTAFAEGDDESDGLWWDQSKPEAD